MRVKLLLMMQLRDSTVPMKSRHGDMQVGQGWVKVRCTKTYGATEGPSRQPRFHKPPRMAGIDVASSGKSQPK